MPPRSRLRSFAPALALAGVLAGCSAVGAGSSDSGVDITARPAPAARLSSNVTGDEVRPWRRPVTVTAARGDVEQVRLTDRRGRRVDGDITASGWTSGRAALLPATRYTLAATAVSADGREVRRRWRFRTAAPEHTDFPAVTPLSDTTVGVGHPVVVYLDHDVQFKKRFERRLDVTSREPATGSWGWIDDRTVAYRPEEYWPANTRVKVSLDVGRTRTAPDRWIMKDRVIRFRTGRSQVLRIDDATHTMTVERDGRAIRTIPVSMGKPGFTTRSGTKVIMSREESRFMDSDTVGIGGSESYALEVPYALRITASGEFIHGAPWSEWAQGSRNVSHGCTNVSLEDAAWLYENSLVGDPVVTTGTGRETEPWNGLGGIWNFPWPVWQERSALA